MKNFAIKGDIVFAPKFGALQTAENSFLVCENGKIAGIFKSLPEKFSSFETLDFSRMLVAPGFVDLHTHAPQYFNRGTLTDLELLEWLDKATFPEEAKFANADYARKAYSLFAKELKEGATTRACVFASLHLESTLILMELLEKSGLKTFVGKVCQDRNSPDFLREISAEDSIRQTKKWLSTCNFKNTKPILTPRFIPACSDALMAGLAEIQKNSKIPVQSHLDENPSEVEWVKSLCPDSSSYADAYNRRGLFGGANCKTIMAHCVHVSADEIELMREKGVFVAHCASSNANLSSGVAPVLAMVEKGVKVGIGTDIAAGESLDMTRTLVASVQASKLRSRWTGEKCAISMAEAFFLATKGGGEFFGKVGSFERGFEADIVVFDDGELNFGRQMKIEERLERLIYSGNGQIKAKFVAGERLK